MTARKPFSRLFTSSIVALILLTLAPAAVAGAEQGKGWKLTGPSGATVEDLLIDPLDPEIVYVGTWLSGVFRSTDGGVTWTAVNDGFPVESPSDYIHVPALAADASTDPATLYAGVTLPATVGADVWLYRSLDRGETWTVVNEEEFGYSIHAVAVDPGDPAILYVGTSFGYFRTEDGGESWRQKVLSHNDSSVLALAVTPAEPSVLYAGTTTSVYRVTFDDSGSASSERLESGFYVYDLEVHPEDPAILYVGAIQGLFRTLDGGESWTEPAVDVLESSPLAVAFAPSDPDVVYVSSFGGTGSGEGSGGVFRSGDGGNSWAPVHDGLDDLAYPALGVHPTDPESLLVGTRGTGIFRSHDGGNSWSVSGRGLHHTVVNRLFATPPGDRTLYATVWNGQIHRSADAGVSWTVISNGFDQTRFEDLVVDPYDPANLYTSSLFDDLFRSTDGGASWTSIGEGMEGDSSLIRVLAIDPTDPAVLFAGTGIGFKKLYRSTDRGDHWTLVFEGSQVVTFVFDPTDSSRIWAGTVSNGVLRTTDGGDSWAGFGPGLVNLTVLALAVDPTDPSIVYAGGHLGWFHRSTDGGESWTVIDERFATDDIYDLAIDPIRPSTIYAGTRGEGVFRSTDGGVTWAPLNLGLGNLRIWDLEVLPTNDLTQPAAPVTQLFAGTNTGLFKIIELPEGWRAQPADP